MTNVLTAAQARQRARELREKAMKEPSSAVRYQLKQLAEEYDKLAAALEDVRKR